MGPSGELTGRSRAQLAHQNGSGRRVRHWGHRGMESLQGKTAVVTGGASGMGRAFADRFSRAGMRVVVADIEQGALDAGVDEIKATGADVIGVVTDVSSEASMRALAERAFAEFGQVNVVCLNAGVAGG